MKIGLSILGVLLFLMGAVWFLQGINVLLGSVMTGQPQWVAIGALVAAIGTGLVVFANTRRTQHTGNKK